MLKTTIITTEGLKGLINILSKFKADLEKDVEGYKAKQLMFTFLDGDDLDEAERETLRMDIVGLVVQQRISKETIKAIEEQLKELEETLVYFENKTK